MSGRALLRAGLGVLLLGAAALAQDSDALARFRKAFDGQGTTDERVAAAAGISGVKGRSGPELVCRALGASLERSEALAKERSAVRAGPGDRARPEERRRLEADLRARSEEEGRIERALREALLSFTDPGALEWLAGNGLRGSPVGAVRAAAAEALGRSGSADPVVIRSVRGALKDRDPQVREAALRAVSLLAAKEEATLRDLAASLEDARWTVRIAAARGLADMAIPGAVDLLVARLAKEAGHEARVMGALLGALTGQRFGVEADGWRHWWEDNRAAFVSGGKTLSPGAGSAAPARTVSKADAYYGIPIESRRVLFILDISESMTRPGGKDPNYSKDDEAKQELLRCIRAFDPGSSFGIFAFSDAVRKWRPGIVKAVPAEKEDARKWVEDLEPAAWTNTFAALEEAIRASAADPRNNMGDDYGLFADTIFLLTDGAPTDSMGRAVDEKGRPEWPRVLEAVRGWNREKRVSIHCIGVGPDINGSFLAALASENGGTYVTVK